MASDGFYPRPLLLIALLSSGSMLMYTMRFNTTIALNGASGVAAKEGWTNEQKGQVLGGFFWGYVVLQVPGGLIASRYGGKSVLALSMVGTVITTAIAPLVAGSNVLPLVLVRGACGLAQSSLYPAWAVVCSEHLPSHRRNLAAAAFSAGSSVGVIVMWLVGPPIQQKLGWEYVFYAPAACGALWCLLWAWLAPSRPRGRAAPHGDAEAATSSETERLINSSRTDRENSGSQSSAACSWLGTMLMSPAMIGVYMASLASSWVFYTLLSFLPQYMHQRYGLDLQNAAAVSVIPYAVRFCILMVTGWTADLVLGKGVSVLLLRKMTTSLALLIPAAALFVMAVEDVSQDAALVMLAVGVGISGLVNVGSVYAPIEMFPDSAGGAYGMGNMFGNIAGIVAPALTGVLLDQGHCPKASANTTAAPEEVLPSCQAAWDKVFLIAVAVSVAGTLAYIVVGGWHPVYRGASKRR